MRSFETRIREKNIVYEESSHAKFKTRMRVFRDHMRKSYTTDGLGDSRSDSEDSLLILYLF